MEATVTDFQKWEKEAKKLSLEQLNHVIQDCQKAEESMRGWNPQKENFYADQKWTFLNEKLKRERK